MNIYKYESFKNDPYGVRIYTLPNGLKVYLAQDFDEPRIKTRIAVKAGATSDPNDATGLAHYVEHMMFKGTDLIGALNRDKEASIISKIKNSYEELASTDTPEDIIRINSEIDKLSSAASLEAIPGELDKLYSIMGCRGTNARTGFEETVYENDIPKVELERWISLEKERFTSPVLRLFPPELEVVYEEFNQAQDDDVSRAFDTFLNILFPKHPYGRSGILGKGTHLKKPSMEKIEEFLERWYTPGNMALILTGDLEFDETIELISNYWAEIPQKTIFREERVVEEPLLAPSSKTLYGAESPFVLLGYRFDGFGSEDELYLTLIDMIMSNNQAGLLDLNLVQTQKVLEAESSYEIYRDYSWFTLYGVPSGNKSLKSVVKLLLKEIELLKRGAFETWYNDAVITCFEIDKIADIESANKIEGFVDAFVTDLNWGEYLERLDRLKKITFNSLIEFINRKFKDNYRVVYKKKGNPKNILYIKKPNLTPVVLNREVESTFCSSFKKMEIPRNEPVFADFSLLDKIFISKNRALFYEKNNKNELFELLITVNEGRFDDLRLSYGVEYRDFIGTELYSPKEFQQELFKRGLDLVLDSKDDTTSISLSGRSRDMNVGLKLLHNFITDGKAFEQSYRKFIKRIGAMRKNAKSSKRMILWGGLYNYVYHGKNSPFRHYLTLKSLRSIGSEKLIKLLENLFHGAFEFYYYGPSSKDEVVRELSLLSDQLPLKETLNKRSKFTLTNHKESKFFFTHYDMVQAEILLTGQGVKYSKDLLPVIFLFNEYFGGGMDSVVFQEVRERRGLAYSAYANYSIPKNSKENFVFNFYVGTQGDKVLDALRCILGLIEFFPKAHNHFDAVKSSILKNIENEGVLKRDLYFLQKESNRLGVDIGLREHVYEAIKKLTIDDLEKFFNEYIRELMVHTLILGNKKNISLPEIETIIGVKGDIVTLKTLYGY